MTSDRWLTKNEYARIRYKAKKMGAVDVVLNYIWHHVAFDYTIVSFVFKPFDYKIHLRHSGSAHQGDFYDKEGAEKIKADLDRALAFVDFLKEFDKTIKN